MCVCGGDILTGASQYATCLPIHSHRKGDFFVYRCAHLESL